MQIVSPENAFMVKIVSYRIILEFDLYSVFMYIERDTDMTRVLK